MEQDGRQSAPTLNGNVGETRRTTLQSWAINGALVIGSVLCSLILVEIGLRFLWIPWDLQSTPGIASDPIYGYAPIPGVEGMHVTPEYSIHFHHTLQGLRGKRIFTHERPIEIRHRVLLLGDSFTYGYGSNDDETYAALLQQAWPDVEVANTGCNGYGTRNELAVLDHFGAAFQPDLTVLFFFWNDLSDNLKRSEPSFVLNSNGQVVRTDTISTVDDPLEIHEKVEAEIVRPRKLYLEHLLEDGLKVWRYRFWGMKLPFVHTSEEMETAWNVTEELLLFSSLRAKEINSRFVLVCLPDHNQVNPQAKIRSIEPLVFDIQERLGTICKKYNIPFIDLLSPMKERWEKTHEPYYFYADRHLTPQGNRLVAELLQPRLEEFWAIP